MYQIIVEEIGGSRLRRESRVLAAEACRISALSSADYCLRDRVEVDWGKIAWKGRAGEIRRLFEAERLDDTCLDALDQDREYMVLFLGQKPYCSSSLRISSRERKPTALAAT